jgi:biotin synthase
MKILEKKELTKSDIIYLLNVSDPDLIEKIRSKAYSIMKENVGEYVYLRGLIEFSNICNNDCYYCGIRKSNKNIKRYILEENEIMESALWCAEQGYGSLVLQSGERQDKAFIDFIVKIVQKIKRETRSEKLPNGLGITLCVGEQTKDTYKKFFDAGAHRYLLRIETSNPELFKSFHPDYQSFDIRLKCLEYLKEVGFQVGTGVMIGLPNQTTEHLAEDILFFKNYDIDMIGMGPFIVHKDTPFSYLFDEYLKKKRKLYELSLRMIAVTRIVLKDVNIASTSALQAMYPMGREAGLMYGANVIMPLLTPTNVRKEYQLYEGKPCIDEFANDCFACIQLRIESTGRLIAFNVYGDSKHFTTK